MKKITLLLIIIAHFFILEKVSAQVNILANGGFEDPVNPYSMLPGIHNREFVRPLRVTYFFNTLSEKTFPISDPAQAIGDYTWFHRTSNNNRWFLFTYIEPKNGASTMSYEVPHSGEKSMALYFATGEAKANVHDFVASLGQRVQLNDKKKYTLKFYVQKDSHVWGAGDADINHAEKINIGIVSSNDASSNFTYYTTYTLPTNDEWTEVNVALDLPAIIAANPGKSFTKCAVFVSLVPTAFNASNVLLKHQVNVDDFSLTEDTGAGVENITVNNKFKVINNILYSKVNFEKLTIYDIMGKVVYVTNDNSAMRSTGVQLSTGIYILDIDNNKAKILIK